jgi:hypothetical protein
MLLGGRGTPPIWFDPRRRLGEVVPLVSPLSAVLCFPKVAVLHGEILHLGVLLEGVLLEVLLLGVLFVGLVVGSLILRGPIQACSACSLVAGLCGHGLTSSWLWPLVVIRLVKFLFRLGWGRVVTELLGRPTILWSLEMSGVWGFLLSNVVFRWVVGWALLVRRPRFVLGSLYHNDGLLVVGVLGLLVLFYLGGVRATCLGASKLVCF